jgi:hypothetical protein
MPLHSRQQICSIRLITIIDHPFSIFYIQCACSDAHIRLFLHSFHFNQLANKGTFEGAYRLVVDGPNSVVLSSLIPLSQFLHPKGKRITSLHPLLMSSHSVEENAL